MIRCVFLGYMLKIARALHASPGIELLAAGVEPQRLRSAKAIEYFEKSNIRWFDARKVREHSEAFELFSRADIVVVGAFGQILSNDLLQAPKYGVLNFHPSLLPAYRGGSPIEEQILRGDTEGGITAHWMTEQVDDGPWVGAQPVCIEDSDDYEMIYEKCESAAEVLMKDLALVNPMLWPRREIHSNAPTFPVRIPDDGEISWSDAAILTMRKVRALGWRGWARARLDSDNLVIRSAKIEKIDESFQPGVVIEAGDKPLIATGKDCLRITEFNSSRPLRQGEVLQNFTKPNHVR